MFKVFIKNKGVKIVLSAIAIFMMLLVFFPVLNLICENNIRFNSVLGETTVGARRISDVLTFNGFANYVANNGGTEDPNANLVKDIDCKGATLRPVGMKGDDINWSEGYYNYNSVFDGQGYTISNFKIEVSFKKGSDCYVGLFGALGEGAVIKNLRLKNFEIILNGNVRASIGGIAGYIGEKNVIIENCVVEDATFTVNIQKTSGYGETVCGGILGELEYVGTSNRPIISNCAVLNPTYNLKTNYIPFYVTTAGIGPAGGIAYNNVNIQDCYVKNIDMPSGITGNDQYKYKPYWAIHREPNNVNYLPDTVYNEKSEAIEAFSNNDAYYVAPTDEFKDGWPYLKIFIKSFYHYYFYTNGNNDSKIIVEVPSEVAISIDKNSSTLVVYGTIITAENKANNGMDFAGWNEELTRIYRATYKLREFAVTFKYISDVKMLVNEVEQTEDLKFSVTWGTEVHYEENKSENWFKYVLGDYTIVYYPDKTKTIKSNNLSVSKITSVLVVSPIFDFKEYSSQFK